MPPDHHLDEVDRLRFIHDEACAQHLDTPCECWELPRVMRLLDDGVTWEDVSPLPYYPSRWERLRAALRRGWARLCRYGLDDEG